MPGSELHTPDWVRSDHYDIEARAAGQATKDQMRLMMQSLLAERFKLAVHWETRQAPVFALVDATPESPGRKSSRIRRATIARRPRFQRVRTMERERQELRPRRRFQHCRFRAA